MTNELTVLPTPIDVSPEEMVQILTAFNLIALTKPTSTAEIKKQEASGVDVLKLIKLGIFADSMAGVHLRNGTVLISESVLRNQMLRLDAKAQQMESASELIAITYPMGYLGGILTKHKAKVILLEANAAPLRVRQESWNPGDKVLPPAQSA